MKKKILMMFLSLLMVFSLASCFSFLDGVNENKTNNTNDKEDNQNDEDVPSIVLVEDDRLVKKTSGEIFWYQMNLALGEEYHLNCSLGNYSGSEYTIVYIFEVDENYTDCATIENNILKTKPEANTGDRIYLSIRLQNKKGNIIDHINIFITVVDPLGLISLNLTSIDDNVVVKEVGWASRDFEFQIPMAGKFYKMPLSEVKNYKDDFHITYTVDEDNDIILSYDENVLCFMLDPDLPYKKKEIYINLLNNEDEIIKTFICKVSFTYDDPDIFLVSYGKNQISIQDGDTIYLEKEFEGQTPIVLNYNGARVNTLNSVISFEVEDDTVISHSTGTSQFGYSHLLNANNYGKSNVKIYYHKGYDNERVVSFDVVVYDGKTLEGIYVPQEGEAFSISGNNVYVNGRIYALYQVGLPEAINGSDDLIITLEDTLDSNVKKIILEYTYKGVTKSVSYLVNVIEEKEFEKTEITQNYEIYHNNRGYHTAPLKGECKVLAIPVWFTDSSSFINEALVDDENHTQKEQIILDLETILFGSNDDVKFNTLRGYYFEESYASLKISGKVTDWFNSNQKSTDFSDKDNEITNLVNKAVKWYFDESGTTDTRSDYDGNNDGYIDSVILYYGSNYHCFHNNNSPVSSAWCRKTTSISEPVNCYSWISAFHMYTLAGIRPTTQLNTADLSTIRGLDATVTIHEFGHNLGLPDLYDTNHTSIPAGLFNMQSNDMGSHDPYSLMALGYAKPYVFDSSDTTLANEITITIHDLQSSGDIILLTPKWDNTNQIFDEYLLIELYTPTGLNAYHARNGYDFVGIRLWHVNAKINPSTKKHYYSNNSTETTYDLLHYIRNNEEESYHTLSVLSEDNVFKKGDTFTMDKYKSQFYNANGKLDSGLDLGFSFSVLDIVTDQYGNATATIKITKTI